jgi:hypothetical protein
MRDTERTKMKLRILGGAVVAFSTLALSSCGAGLSASSTCSNYLSASPSDQLSIAEKMAGQYNKPDYATPLGEPDIAYYCASNPSVTLGQFFTNAQD